MSWLLQEWQTKALNKPLMKKYYFTLLLLFRSFSTFAIAQTHPIHTSVPIDSRFHQVFDGDILFSLNTSDAILLQRWNFYLNLAWQLSELPIDKASADSSPVRINFQDNFNFVLKRKVLPQQHSCLKIVPKKSR